MVFVAGRWEQGAWHGFEHIAVVVELKRYSVVNSRCYSLHCTASHDTTNICYSLHCTASHDTTNICYSLRCTASHDTTNICYSLHCTASHDTTNICYSLHCMEHSTAVTSNIYKRCFLSLWIPTLNGLYAFTVRRGFLWSSSGWTAIILPIMTHTDISRLTSWSIEWLSYNYYITSKINLDYYTAWAKKLDCF